MKTSQDSWWHKVLYGVGWFGFSLLVLVACVQTMYLLPVTSDILTNADIIQLPTMFLDLQADLHNFWGWKLPDAPYYFPDTLVFLGINWLLRDSWQSIATYSLAQAGLVTLSLCWLYRVLGGKKIGICLVILLGALLVQTNIYTSIFSQVQGLTTPYVYYLSSYIHFGTYLSSLFCLAVSLAYIRSRNQYLLLIVGIISFITTVSDLIFAVYFTLPFMGVIFVINKAKLLPAINLKRFSTILFFTSFAGYIFNKHFDTLAATTTVELKLSKVYQSITRLLIDLWQTILTEKLYLTAMIVLPLVYLIWYLLQNTKKLRGTSSLINTHSTILPLMTCLFVLNGVIFNIFSVIILGKYSDIHTAR